MVNNDVVSIMYIQSFIIVLFLGDDIYKLLNNNVKREETDVEIEYKYERGKKVRVISAPKIARGRKPIRDVREPYPPSQRGSVSPHDHHHEIVNQKQKEEIRRKKKIELQQRKGPVKPGSRPKWGFKNKESIKPKKQSEKDPFYERKKRESDMRRTKREQRLLAMVDANKAVIPDYYVPPPRSRSRSRDPSPFSDVEIASPRMVKQSRRSKSHSPHRHQEQTNVLTVNHGRRAGASPVSTKAESIQEQQSIMSRPSQNRSPPVPALKHRQNNQNMDNMSSHRKQGRYGDVDPLDIPIQNGDFVPFTRTIEVLDPTKAEEPLPLSREATRVANARRAYYEGLHPEKYGNKQYVYVDKHRVIPGQKEGNSKVISTFIYSHYVTKVCKYAF